MKKNLFLLVYIIAGMRLGGQNIGIGTNAPVWKLDVRGAGLDDGALISVGNSDQSHRMLLFGGRQNDPYPFIQVRAGDPLRFASDESGFKELMIINPNGSVGINTPTPDASAILDLNSDSKGILVPRLTTGQRTGIASPANGLLVYDNTTKSFWYHNGTAWVNLSGNGWSLTGNAGTSPSVNFLGTTNKRSLQFKINNSYAGAIDTSKNVFLGTNAGKLDAGFSSVAIGFNAFKAAGGGEMVAIGTESLGSNVSGIWNTALGSYSMALHRKGNANTAVGYAALDHDTSGISNTAVGAFALSANINGFANNAFGNNALMNNTTGLRNTAVGLSALKTNQTGNNNTAIGYLADVSEEGLFNATAIGANAVAAASNTVILGNNANVGIGTPAPAARLEVRAISFDAYAGIMISNANPGGKPLTINQGTLGKINFTNPGVIDLVTMDFNNNRVGINVTSPAHLLQLGSDDAYKPATSTWGVLSDKRVKENIQPFTDGLNLLQNINPVWFDYNGQAGTHKGERAIGTLAQDIKQLAPYMVSEMLPSANSTGKEPALLGVNYHALFFILINAVKEQHTLITQLQQEVEILKKNK